MTARRRAALKKAQAVSARKRRGRRRAVTGGVLVGMGGLGVARHVLSGSVIGYQTWPTNKSGFQFDRKKYKTTRYLFAHNRNGTAHGIIYNHGRLRDRADNKQFRRDSIRINRLTRLERKMIRTEQRYFKRTVRQTIKKL